jgi:hypothetical protein
MCLFEIYIYIYIKLKLTIIKAEKDRLGILLS